jgi:hypothetical protein
VQKENSRRQYIISREKIPHNLEVKKVEEGRNHQAQLIIVYKKIQNGLSFSSNLFFLLSCPILLTYFPNFEPPGEVSRK